MCVLTLLTVRETDTYLTQRNRHTQQNFNVLSKKKEIKIDEGIVLLNLSFASGLNLLIDFFFAT